MRKMVLFTLLMLSIWVAFGIHSVAYGMDMDEQEAAIAEVFMAQHISAVCATKVSPREVLYVGENDGQTYFYTNVYYNDSTHKCTVFTRDLEQVWSYPTAAIND